MIYSFGSAEICELLPGRTGRRRWLGFGNSRQLVEPQRPPAPSTSAAVHAGQPYRMVRIAPYVFTCRRLTCVGPDFAGSTCILAGARPVHEHGSPTSSTAYSSPARPAATSSSLIRVGGRRHSLCASGRRPHRPAHALTQHRDRAKLPHTYYPHQRHRCEPQCPLYGSKPGSRPWEGVRERRARGRGTWHTDARARQAAKAAGAGPSRGRQEPVHAQPSRCAGS